MRLYFLKIFISFLIFNSSIVMVEAQLQGQAKIDSLLKELPKMNDDTNKVNKLYNLSRQYNLINLDECIKFGELGVKIAEKIEWKQGEANCFNALGYIYSYKKINYPKALEFHLKALKINEELGRKDHQAINLANIGIIYSNQSNYPKALEYYLKAMKIDEELGNKNGVARHLGNIGTIYEYQYDYPKALEYYQKSLIINKELGNNSGMAINLGNIGIIYAYKSDYPKALEYYLKALKLDEELGNKNGVARHLGNIGSIYDYQSDYPKALEYSQKALKIDEEIGNKNGVARHLGNIGILYKNQSDYPKALEYHLKSLKIYEELGNKNGEALQLGNIGIIYVYQSDYPKALEYYLKSLKLYEKLEVKHEVKQIFKNIGILYTYKADYPKALEYFLKSLKLNEELGDKQGIASNLGDLGLLYLNQSDYPKALEYYHKSLKLNEELGYQIGEALHLGNIGLIYLKISQNPDSLKLTVETDHIRLKNEINLNLSIDYLLQSIKKFKEIGNLNNLSLFQKYLADAYELKGDFQNAYLSFKEYKVLQDSVFNIDKQKELSNLESKRELELKEKENLLLLKDNQLFNAELLQKNQKINLAEKEKEVQRLAFLKEQAEKQEKEKQLSLTETQMKLQKSQIESLDKVKKIQNAEIKAKNLQRYFFIGGIVVFVLLFLFAFVRFREKKKLSDRLAMQKKEIEKQKELVETQKDILVDKNEQIYASINYAATIQNALLPWSSVLNRSLKEHFVIYKPKDIVSGDSYWFQEVDGMKFLAVIDCTGHGVPGSMLTVIANSVLDDAVLSKKLTSASDILTYMNEKVTEVLNQRLAENSIRDGMEVALIAIHQNKIQFSGAGRPLYLKNGTMEIIKTDKRGIAGQSENDDYQFSSVEIEMNENMTLYLTSDGYADQMNENSKKYSTKRLVALLDSISELSLEKQKEVLENELNSHKGNREQIDDVTIIGVKL